ncbi:DUF4097 domain-containing protein [Labilibacter sediminis]|nr:DUF4097 domain-containing protein [Labilibacter sediminis]
MRKLYQIILVAFTITLCNGCLLNDLNGQLTVIDQVEKSFDNVASITIKGSFCFVNIDSHSSNSIELKGEIKSRKERDDIKIKYKQNSSDLEVWIERPKSLKGSINGTLTLKVPSNTNITVKNSSGSIAVKNIGQSIVDLTSVSGSVNCENIDSDLKAHTTSGSIKAANISGSLNSKSISGSQYIRKVGRNATLSSTSGKSEIENVNGTLKISGTSGSQVIRKVNGDVISTSVSGSIQLEDITGNIKAKNVSGSIKINGAKGNLALESVSGSLHGNQITLTGDSNFKSTSGSIKMELTNKGDELSFDLKALSGSLKAKGNSGYKKLNISRGPITIKGVSSSGSQNYY